MQMVSTRGSGVGVGLGAGVAVAAAGDGVRSAGATGISVVRQAVSSRLAARNKASRETIFLRMSGNLQVSKSVTGLL